MAYAHHRTRDDGVSKKADISFYTQIEGIPRNFDLLACKYLLDSKTFVYVGKYCIHNHNPSKISEFYRRRHARYGSLYHKMEEMLKRKTDVKNGNMTEELKKLVASIADHGKNVVGEQEIIKKISDNPYLADEDSITAFNSIANARWHLKKMLEELRRLD